MGAYSKSRPLSSSSSTKGVGEPLRDEEALDEELRREAELDGLLEVCD